ncbi:MAG: hypothetical protein PHQ95_03465 [Candidatus Gracilibacteria bacterium]|nr:hypothetical protein [Candidatus Gracilibacteria bacterium]
MGSLLHPTSSKKDYDTSVEFPEGVVAIKKACKAIVDFILSFGKNKKNEN